MTPRSATIPTAHESAHDARPVLMAHYATLVDVRHAVERLAANGVDGDDIAVVGDAAVETEQTLDRARSDERLVSNVTLSVVLGTVVGAVVGAALGALFVGGLLLGWSDLAARGWIFALLVVWFAGGGSLVGAFAGVMRATGFSESLPLTFADEPDRPLWLAVYGSRDIRPTIDATHPLEIVIDPDVMTAHPEEGGAASPR